MSLGKSISDTSGRAGVMVRSLLTTFTVLVALVCATPSAASEAPRIETRNGRHALIVDGRPFLILGAQANNSSNYPAALPQVWPVIEKIGANTLIMPVSWDQIEAKQGRFDFSFVDTLLEQARARDKRLVLLWFATWKNANSHNQPLWVKLNPKRYPRMTNADGSRHNSASPFARSTLEADKRAFVALMTHLKQVDPQNTVLMVQVQNEPGSYRLVRDHSPEAEAAFRGAVPAELRRRLKKPGGTWTAMFGEDAELAFQSWSVASYIDAIAAAGKAVKPTPMYANAALPQHTTGRQDPTTLAAGGPIPAMLDIWKAAAPHIDVLAPDIYNGDHTDHIGFLDSYTRPDNALFVPEVSSSRQFARFFFAAIGRGAIGWSPFGMDTTYSNYPLGARTDDQAALDAFAANYRLFAPLVRVWPKLALQEATWGIAEPNDPKAKHEQVADLGREWRVNVTFGRPEYSWEPPPGNNPPTGGVAIAMLGRNEYLVTGVNARVAFQPIDDRPGEDWTMAQVEEGHYDAAGEWVFDRLWTGDQTNFGLNFKSSGTLLKVTLARLE